jgi:hypothetical protein
MNPHLNDRRLNGAAWRRRYRAAFSTLLHFKLTVQTMALPDDPVPEQLSEADLERFLNRLLSDLGRFVSREVRFTEALGSDLRRWRIGELLPILDLFDETAGLALTPLPPVVRDQWLVLSQEFIRLKAQVIRLHIFNA